MSSTPDYVTAITPGTGRRAAARSWLHTDAPSLDLSGEWAFRLLPHAAGDTAFVDPDTSVDDWESMAVPSHWVLGHDGRYGSPIYTNVQFPFPVDPPFVPDANPTGDYRRDFEIAGGQPEGAAGGSADGVDAWTAAATHLLRFDGVESTYKVWLNGVEIGTGAGSRLAQEFDVTGVLRPGRNTLAVRVHQWSAASYVEDQDQWWLPGIFREVTVVARPVGGLDDVWLRTGWSVRDGGSLDPEIRADESAFPVRLTIAELGVDVTWVSPAEVVPLSVAGAEPWSAESPRLYEATVTSVGETVTQRVGFRTVRIDGDLLLVNDRRLVFHGMNRHESHPDRGRVFDEQHARDDLARMKRFNVNAIRTSHYPPHPRLLDLCDELGLWVVLECDLETHGFERGASQNGLEGWWDRPADAWVDNPSDDPRWRDVYVDRMERTVERDKNHASIVIWSLGNEAGTGSNLAAMSAWVHDRDPERPVHYEGDRTGSYTDVYSRMYSSIPETESIGSDTTELIQGATAAESARLRQRPFLLCEYVHAMGNGPGAIDQYEDLVDRHPRLHGGFVWEWRDHGIRTRTADGTDFFGYGGDFGEVVHDGNFVMDGMILSDETPTPGLHEYAAVVAPFRFAFSVENEGSGLTISNHRHSRLSDDVRFVWHAEVDGVEVASGALEVPSIAAGSSVAVPLPTIDVGDDGETWLTVEAVTSADAVWAPVGHVVAAGQHDLTPLRSTRPLRSAFGSRPARSLEALPAGVHRLGPAVFEGGQLVELAGRPVADPTLALFRAPTDNDSLSHAGQYDSAGVTPNFGTGEPGFALGLLWEAAGLDRITRRILRSESDGTSARQLARYAAAASRHSVSVETTWEASGDDVLLSVAIAFSSRWDLILPRIGMRLDLPGAVDEASWFGTGPGESYPDSMRAARVGRFAAGIDELSAQYARPQETGHRSAFRSLDLAAAGSPWLRVAALADEAGRRPGFTLSRHTAEEIAGAAHPHELPTSTGTHLYVDAAQNGLGSRACGVDVWPEFALRPEARALRLVLSAL
ncbi:MULTISPECIES: glycoside hydrolase family 2 TIM barrel-domain containing protein [unclassified Frondihabitans]|uniref:glycoside hydrolase family 2 TIM barrel-domain containing protein n=1 Tax=unclassified Frondihabitans TaxID=2626248 RepID=UPI000F51269B|nr:MULTISPECIES: glycoside hydrolase family 2 TIM barrel-domain containing protein [unclassified Frondihabitans]RPE78587.1 beta-galactosidase [Frondihabitans sp. PhB153]RPF08868.1 beta-galactosidase [Frondihabitans sp. PhB161]